MNNAPRVKHRNGDILPQYEATVSQTERKTMKNPHTHIRMKTGGLLLTTIAVLLVPNASALSNPSGDYLRLSDNHVLAYDNTTGTFTDLGVSPYPTTCTTLTSPSQCGQCAYVPQNSIGSTNDNKGWEIPTSQYTYGACANADVNQSNGHTAWVRGNVQVVLASGDNWYVTFTTKYYNSAAQLTWTDTPTPQQTCAQDFSTSRCPMGPYSWDPTAHDHVPPGTVYTYYCVYTNVFETLTGSAVDVADECSNVIT
jgi:hypothetical protein